MYVFKRRKLKFLSITLPSPASSHAKVKSQKVALKSETLEPAHRLKVQLASRESASCFLYDDILRDSRFVAGFDYLLTRLVSEEDTVHAWLSTELDKNFRMD